MLFTQSGTFYLPLSDIDECQLGEPCGPNSRCHNTNGSFYCTCQRDYIPTSGTQHFSPRDVKCKGQCEDRDEHKLASTFFLGGGAIAQYSASRCNLEF